MKRAHKDIFTALKHEAILDGKIFSVAGIELGSSKGTFKITDNLKIPSQAQNAI